MMNLLYSFNIIKFFLDSVEDKDKEIESENQQLRRKKFEFAVGHTTVEFPTGTSAENFGSINFRLQFKV